MKTITIIGGGNLGGAIACGLAASGLLLPAAITVVNRTEARSAALRAQCPGLTVVTGDYSSLSTADLVVLAVKPWDVRGVIADHLSPTPPKRQMLVSVAAGISLAQLAEWSGTERALFCAIPNTAVALRESMTYVCALHATEEEQAAVVRLFGALGRAELIEESRLPAAMALCSCGIAFAFRYIRASIEGAVELGLRPAEARRGILQTLRGAVELLEAHGEHPEAEIDKVTTAGGLTIRGLNELEHAGFTSAVVRGLKACR